MLPATSARVEAHSPEHVNRRIQEEIEASVRRHAGADRAAVDARLRDLDREWDMERVLEANAATLALTGVLLGAFVDRRFLVLPGVVTAFLLQHALQGWCPPVPVFRRMGVRTASEIGRERYALKALRGDFDATSRAGAPMSADRAPEALAAARLTAPCAARPPPASRRTPPPPPGRRPGSRTSPAPDGSR